MKFAFTIPEVRVLVEAADASAAIEVIEDEIIGRQSKTIDRPSDAQPPSTGAWLIRTYYGEITQIQACIVCGCTDDDACEEGCFWVASGLCSTEDDPHLSARARFGLEDDDGVSLVFEVTP